MAIPVRITSYLICYLWFLCPCSYSIVVSSTKCDFRQFHLEASKDLQQDTANFLGETLDFYAYIVFLDSRLSPVIQTILVIPMTSNIEFAFD